MMIHLSMKYTRRIYLILLGMVFLPSLLMAQDNYETTPKEARSWREFVSDQPDSWFLSDEAKRVADNVLLFQLDCGGWPKNEDMSRHLSNREEADLQQAKKNRMEATIDNGATTTEMQFMARIYAATKDSLYRNSFKKGLTFLFDLQLDNGGWPQFFKKKGYAQHITYNDDAMVNVMRLLLRVVQKDATLDGLLSETIVARAKSEFDKGIGCILKTQIVVDGKRTVWCAQHDEVTLKPAKARAYELPSYSGKESAEIVKLLMSIKNPSEQVVEAVRGAVEWFEQAKIEGKRMMYYTNAQGKKDRHLVDDPSAEPLWARFYDLDDMRPFVCDRDGVKKYSLDDIGYERRMGYSWYAGWGKSILAKYPKWLAKTSKQ